MKWKLLDFIAKCLTLFKIVLSDSIWKSKMCVMRWFWHNLMGWSMDRWIICRYADGGLKAGRRNSLATMGLLWNRTKARFSSINVICATVRSCTNIGNVVILDRVKSIQPTEFSGSIASIWLGLVGCVDLTPSDGYGWCCTQRWIGKSHLKVEELDTALV